VLANYGYQDGGGSFFITIDTDRCDGCGDCVQACPTGVVVVGEDEHDPLNDDEVAAVTEDHRKKLKYSCGPCKGEGKGRPPPCVVACTPAAICHSW
jgi:NAD-dependent dihydropyrimidine dehydrogenase PreA subunit